MTLTASIDTPQFNVGIDYNEDDFICWEAATTDKLNKVVDLGESGGALALDTWNYSRILTNETITVVDAGSLYGTKAFNIAVTATDSGIRIWRDTVPSYSITLTNGQVYTIILWAKMISGVGTFDIRMQLRTQNDATTKTTVDGTMNNTSWTPLRGTFTANASDSNLTARVWIRNIVGSATFQITGVMLFQESASVAQQGYNTGDTTDLYENISEWVKTANWFVGMRPYTRLGDENLATIVVDNRDRLFSQEYTSSPIFEGRPVGKKLQIRWDEMSCYIGFIEKITPAPFRYGERTATITCHGLKRYLEKAVAELSYQESKRTDEYISQMLLSFDATIDTSAIQQGQTTLSYFGDNSADNNKQTVNIYETIKQLVTVEQGWFYINELGNPAFMDRHAAAGLTSELTVDNDEQDLTYAPFGERLANRAVVRYYPRAISGGSVTLFSLDANITIPRGQTYTFRTPYKDSSGNRIGGKNVVTPSGGNYTITGGSPVLTFTARGQHGRATIDNTAGTSAAVLSVFNVTGNSVKSLNPIEVMAEDTDSIADFGAREIFIDAKGLSNANEASDLANYLIAQFAQERGEVSSFTYRQTGWDSDTPSQLDLGIGDLVTISDYQLGHTNFNYFIVGVEHSLDEGHMLTSKYHVEISMASNFWILGESALNRTTVLGY